VEVEALSLGFEVAARSSAVEGAALEIERVADSHDLRVKVLEAS
jgi:Zn finger protein HypA/HybF involved in hydrogenase expression